MWWNEAQWRRDIGAAEAEIFLIENVPTQRANVFRAYLVIIEQYLLTCVVHTICSINARPLSDM